MSDTGQGIVVLGMPRSGTTLMRRVLSGHPKVFCPPETYLLNAASRFLEEHEFAGGLSIGVVPGLDFSGFSEEEVLARTRDFVTGFLKEAAERAGKARWAEKTAVDIFYLDAIERLLGDTCCYVCVVRHPLDVVCSIKELSDKMEIYLPELHAYVSRYLSPAEAFAHAWADCNRRLHRFCKEHQGNAALFQYEQLVAEPRREIERLFDFLGEAVDVDDLLESAFGGSDSVGLGDWKTYESKGIYRASVGRHAGLDPAIVNRLAEILNPLMPDLDYEPIEPMRAPTGKAARRHLELSLRVAGLAKSAPESNDR